MFSVIRFHTFTQTKTLWFRFKGTRFNAGLVSKLWWAKMHKNSHLDIRLIKRTIYVILPFSPLKLISVIASTGLLSKKSNVLVSYNCWGVKKTLRHRQVYTHTYKKKCVHRHHYLQSNIFEYSKSWSKCDFLTDKIPSINAVGHMTILFLYKEANK